MDFRRLGPLLDLLPYPHARRLLALAGRGGAAIDVGGGTGRVARRLVGPFRRVVVADPERALLERARRKGLEAVRADAAALPFRDGAADLVLCVDALHHFPRQAEALREARRVLSPAGVAVLEEFDPRSVGGRLVEAGERLLGFGSTFHPPDRLLAMARDAGLRATVVRHSARDYAVVARREETKD